MTQKTEQHSVLISVLVFFLCAVFLLYFGILLYSECGLPGQSWANLEKKRFVQGGILLVAILFIRIYPFDYRAQVGALFLAVAGTAPAFPHENMREVWRALPGPLGTLLWVPQLAHFMALPFFFTFYAILPRPIFRHWSYWVLVWLPILVLQGWGLNALYQRIYHPPYLRDLPRWYLFVAGICVLVYGFGGLGALIWNFRTLSARERRRMLVLTVGAVAGWSPGLLFLAAIFLAPFTESRLVWGLVVPPFKHVALAMFVLVPVSMIYALAWDQPWK